MTATVVIPAPRQPEPADRWQLVTRAQQGDPQAFADLYTLYQHTVFRYIAARTYGDRQLTEDLTQDVFLRALRNIGSVSWQGRDIGAWLITIARNIVVDHFKSGRVRNERRVRYLTLHGAGQNDAEAVDTVDMVDADRRGDPAQVAAHNDLSAHLDTALAQLPPDQRQVLALRFGAGLSVIETAEVMGKPVTAIKSAQYRACQSMARILRLAGGPC